MKSWVLLSILSVLLLSTGWAHAGPADRTRAAFETLLTSVPMPPEWEGTWVTVDSVYSDNCYYPGDAVTVSSSEYSICASRDFYPDVTCTGTATATTLHLSCGSSDCGDAGYCCSGYGLTLDATRNGDAFYLVEHYAFWWGCGFEVCSTTRAHGTRTGPVREDDCATATLPATWGGVKALYR